MGPPMRKRGGEWTAPDALKGLKKEGEKIEKMRAGRFRKAKKEDLGVFGPQIGSRVGRNQTTVMRICDRWMQEGTTDRGGRSHPPQCTTSCEERQIVRMAVTDRSVTSRTLANHIESVAHHSVSSRTIQQRSAIQQSGLSKRCPLRGLPLTQNHNRLHRQWCDERRMWVAELNEVFYTDESRICLQHHCYVISAL
ncbi:transposable element Tcb1 transposase [Trichonephila clavipes]|nr:transposable element Tcb1 transposase [Trichonephila clavipes]